MSEAERLDRGDRHTWTAGRWSGWDSPVGLGVFFVLCAVAFDLVRLAFK